MGELDRHRNATAKNADVETRISAYEMAFKMQASVPDLMDISKEPKDVLDLYGATPGDGSFASNCLMARRLAERGVRFIQLYHRDWDHHGDLVKYMNICCGATDRATWALLTDLKRRDLLKDTLVIWGGEFGRTPMFQGKGGPGRDHHIKGFSMWLAGGGVKPGIGYGATDELGYASVENVVHVRDLHATDAAPARHRSREVRGEVSGTGHEADRRGTGPCGKRHPHLNGFGVLMLTAETRRRDFPSLEGRAYLNSAAEGIPPLAVGEALARYFRDKQLGMDGRIPHAAEWDATRR